MKALRRLFFKLFKHYERIEIGYFTYDEGDKRIRQNEGKPEDEQWFLAKEEDTNHAYGIVILERKRRILE